MDTKKNVQGQCFKPAWWLKSPHLQTLYPLVDCFFQQVHFNHHQVDLPDGDFLELALAGSPNAPCCLLLPGTEGSADSPYIKMMTKTLLAMGWQVVVMQYRSCGQSVNQLAKAYNSLDTGDLEFVLSYLFIKCQIKIDYAVGFSMGGNILVHYLETHPHSLEAAACVSTPFDFYESALHLPLFYQRYLLKKLVKKAHEKLDCGIDLPVSKDHLDRFKTLPEFDDVLTAPLYGFDNAEKYYKAARCFPLLGSLRTPIIMLHALDDPFIPRHTVPSQASCAPCVSLVGTESGGHLGFVSGWFPFGRQYWYIDQVLQFLGQYGFSPVESHSNDKD